MSHRAREVCTCTYEFNGTHENTAPVYSVIIIGINIIYRYFSKQPANTGHLSITVRCHVCFTVGRCTCGGLVTNSLSAWDHVFSDSFSFSSTTTRSRFQQPRCSLLFHSCCCCCCYYHYHGCLMLSVNTILDESYIGIRSHCDTRFTISFTDASALLS